MDLNILKIQTNNHICTVRICNPQSLNALNYEVLQELEYAFDLIKNDNEIFVVILTGEGKAFVAGADISFMKDVDALQAKIFSEFGSRVFRKIENLNKVVIAAVNGYALGGGCELAMACDIRIASANAKFGQPEVNLGIIPGFSGTQRLPRLVGFGRAKELIFTGGHINADEAYRIGLVNKVTDKENLMEEAINFAEKIIVNSKNAVINAKESMNRGIETDIDTGIAYESNIFGLCFNSQDQKEGMIAFLEKRTPLFEY
jgi:enoyl-CoA hydratase